MTSKFSFPDAQCYLNQSYFLVIFQNFGMSILLSILMPAMLITARHIAIESMIPSTRNFVQNNTDILKSQEKLFSEAARSFIKRQKESFLVWTLRARLESLVNSVCLMSNGLANTNRINNDHRNGLKYGNTRKDTRTRMKNEIPKKLLVLSKMARRFYKRKE